MRIFQMKPDVEAFRWLTTLQEDDFNVLADMEGAPARDRWTPLRVEWIEDDLSAGKPTSDFPTFGATPTLSQRAVDALLDLVIEAGEVLPLAVETGEPYFVWNITRFVDALDEGASEVTRFSSGGIMRVQRYAFRASALSGAVLFKLPQLRVSVFVTETFVDRVREAGLTGFTFREVWSTGSGSE